MPTDPITKQPYIYNVGSDNSFYSLCALLSIGYYQCIDSSSATSTLYIAQTDVTPAATSTQTFTDSNGAFTYSYPFTWQSGSTTPLGETAVFVVGATSTDTTLGIRLHQFSAFKVQLTPGTTLDQAQQEFIASFQSTTPISNLSTQKITFHGDPAYLSSFRMSSDSINFMATSYLISHHGSIYNLYILGHLEESPLFTPVDNTIVDSFQFTDESVPSISSVSVQDDQNGWAVEVGGNGLIDSSLIADITRNGQTITLSKIATVVSNSQAFFLLPTNTCTQANKYCRDGSLSVSVTNGAGITSNTLNIQ